MPYNDAEKMYAKAKIRMARCVLGLSVQELADIAHVSPRHVRRVEDPCNCREIPNDRIIAFCDACKSEIVEEARRLVEEALRTGSPAVLPVYVSDSHLAADHGAVNAEYHVFGFRISNAAAFAAAAVLTAQGVAVEFAYPAESLESRESRES